MTIRFRNRMTLIFFIITLSYSLLCSVLTLYQFLFNGISLPEIYTKSLSDAFLLRYNPIWVYSGIFLLMLYICITSIIIYHSFEKTQAPDIVFFLMFLIACLCDTTRILVPAFHLSGSFSHFTLKIGNIHLFARLLAPLALMGNTVMSTDDFRQSTDRNSIILIIVALFFAEVIPLNTAIILPNYCISYGYVRAIRIFCCLTCTMSTINLFVINRKNEYKQIMTIGFILLCIGYTLIFYCYNILTLISGILLLGIGTYLYLNEVHKHYLWID
ncbi:hypothetical protein [Treponema bryantii]|nr:hypothetical protein [Treponema bryantii]